MKRLSLSKARTLWNLTVFYALLYPISTFAQRDLGGAREIFGPVEANSGSDVRSAVVTLLKNAITFVALIAVVVIVIAGIIYLVAGWNDSSRERAKNIIIFAVLGIIIISLASIFVLFFTTVVFRPA